MPEKPKTQFAWKTDNEPPTAHDLEVAIRAQCYFAKRVMVTDPRHAEFHHEINLLLNEWQVEKFRARGLTLIQPS